MPPAWGSCGWWVGFTVEPLVAGLSGGACPCACEFGVGASDVAGAVGGGPAPVLWAALCDWVEVVPLHGVFGGCCGAAYPAGGVGWGWAETPPPLCSRPPSLLTPLLLSGGGPAFDGFGVCRAACAMSGYAAVEAGFHHGR